MQIVLQVDDRPLAWFVLRSVSRMLRRITEDVFSNQIIRRKCSIRLVGEHARAFFYDTWAFNDSSDFIGMWHDDDWDDLAPLHDEYPTLMFKPDSRAPASVEARVILHLQDGPADYEGQYGVVVAVPSREDGDETTASASSTLLNYTFFLRRQCCLCPSVIQAVADVAKCECLTDLFFSKVLHRDREKPRLEDGYYFVCLDEKLKLLNIPSMYLDMETLELGFNWLSLCHAFYLDELKLRRIARPWMRYLAVDHSSSQLMVHWQSSLHYSGFFEGFTKRDLLQACKEDGWIFWDRQLTYEPLFHPLECKE